jgi:hypothetical protein
MLLSEAIRLGSMDHPQVFGALYNSVTGGSCALGSAGKSIGLSFSALNTQEYREALISHFPLLLELATHPCYAFFDNPIGMVIVSLNDSFRWNRERIADWVEQIEAARGLIAAKEPVVQEQEAVLV